MTVPDVAFVIPVYRGEEHVRACIESLLEQQGVSVEIVAVDDGSPDGSPQVLQSFGERVKVVQQPNRGVCVARNIGFAQTTAPFVTFIDQDDWLKPDFAQKMLAKLRSSPEAGAVYCESAIHEENGTVYEGKIGDLTKDFYRALLNNQNPMSTGNVMVRRDVFASVGGFDPTLPNIGEDLDLWLKIARYYPWAYVPERLYCWREHSGNMSRNFLPMYRGVKQLLRRHAKLSPRSREDAKLYRSALSHKARVCVADLRHHLKGLAKERKLTMRDLGAALRDLIREPELIPHFLRVPLFRRRR